MQKLFGADRVFGGTVGCFIVTDQSGMRDRRARSDLHLYRAAILTAVKGGQP